MPKHAAPWLIASIGLCSDRKMTLDPTSCGALALARRASPNARSRRAAAAILAALSLTGCAAKAPDPLPPLVVGAVLCPEAAAPALPQVDGGVSFDDPAAWDTMMYRDHVMRSYIDGLRRTVGCYAAQVINP